MIENVRVCVQLKLKIYVCVTLKTSRNICFKLSGDLLENYCWDDDLMNFSRLLFSVQILLTYPIECFVSREVIEHSLFSSDPNVPVTDRTHYLITLLIIASTYFISMATDCLGVVLELNVRKCDCLSVYYACKISLIKLNLR